MHLNEIINQNRVVFKGNKSDGHYKYVRSVSEMVSTLREYYGVPIILEDVIRGFAEHNVVLVDSLKFEMSVDNLWKYREWDRDPFLSRGGRSPEEYDELKQSIQKDGIKDTLIFQINRLENGNVEAYIGEGNHRIRIAKELGITKVPVRFSYRK